MNSTRTQEKPQQLTLSIRISDALRDFLERSKHVISSNRGESVSMSEVARILLESAKDDRLDFRLEVAELQQDPTDSLWAIRKKWEMNQPLSRAEWIFMAQYIQLACEGISENPEMPRPHAFAVLLKALMAVRRLRADRGAGLDRYYLGNLGAEDREAFNERQLEPEARSEIAQKQAQELCEYPHPKKPVFAGRNLYVALRDEILPDVMALNRALEPHLPTLFRLAARGHWIREHRPARVRPSDSMLVASIRTRTAGRFCLAAFVAGDGELRLALEMERPNAIYPLDTYPEIQEFVAMLQQLECDRIWDGVHFHASADPETGDGPALFHFHRHSDGVRFTFSAEEWQDLKGLFSTTLAEPNLRAVLDELSLVYGEL
jgi:hypothetical protein